MNYLVVAVMVLAACKDTAGPGPYEVKRDLKTKSTKTSGLPGGGLPELDDAAPKLTVTGADTALGHALESTLAQSVLIKQGAVTVVATIAPGNPGATGTLEVSMQVVGVFAHLPQVIKLDTTISGTVRYKNRSPADLGKQLGDVIVDYIASEKLPADIGLPTAKVTRATSITVGPPNCTLHEGGTVRCWDGNHPQPVPLPAIAGTTQLDAGNNYGLCGVRANGHVYCVDAWDSSANNEVREVCGIEHATAVSVGQQSACALLADGHVRCWGSRPEWFAPCDKHAAVEVKGVTTATLLDTGAFKSCVLARDGTVHCWELCDKDCRSGVVGEVDVNHPPVATAVNGITKATNVLVGYEICATVKDTHVTCVDNGKARDIAVPEPIRKLVFGAQGSCALGAAGNVYCWRSESKAIRFDGLTDVVDLGADITSMCAVTKTGDVVCAGDRANEDAPAKPIAFRY